MGLGVPEKFTRAPSSGYRGEAGDLSLQDCAAVLIFADLSDEAQVQKVEELSLLPYGSTDAESAQAPFLILVPHSNSSSSRGATGAHQLKTFRQLLNVRIDDMIVGEPEGFKLALEVRARLTFHIRRSADFEEMIKSYEQADRGTFLKQCIDDTLWNYVRIRFRTQIPEIDPDIPLGEPAKIGDFSMGTILGRGSFGKVCQVQDLCNDTSDAKQVIKSISKRGMDIGSIKALKSEIDAMKILSSGDLYHPNVTQLYEIYHSGTHVFLRMEYGGPENLDQRLKSRDSEDNDCRPLSLKKIITIANECMATMKHLHTLAKVVHRDVKGGNIIVSEAMQEDVSIKFVDFGLAKIVQHTGICRGKCGTLPYMAPEILLEDQYDVFATDVWSLGILILDLLCMNRFIQRNYFDQDCAGRTSETRLLQGLRNHFNKPGKVEDILARHLRLEYQELLETSPALLDGMLNVVPKERLSAAQAAAASLHRSEGSPRGSTQN
jgi:hypothetical protein